MTKAKTKLNYRSWRKAIEEGDITSLYLISGEEEYLINHGLKLLEEKLIAPGYQSLDMVTFRDKIDLDKLIDDLGTVAFMSERRMVVVFNSAMFNTSKGSTDDKQKFLTKLKDLDQSGFCLCLIEDKVDGRQKKSLRLWQEAGGVEVQVEKESSHNLLRWLGQYFKNQGIRIESQAAESLILRCDSDMSQLILEADKLAKFCLYAGRDYVDYDLLDLCCREDLQGNIFKLTDAVSAQQTQVGLEILDKLLKQNEPPVLILFMLARHFRQLLAARDAKSSSDLASALRIPPFVAQRLLNQARKFSYQDLIGLCRLSYESDKAIKTGELEERMALELILVAAGKKAS